MIAPELLDALESLPSEAAEFDTYRVAWRTQEVLRGGPGGRWNPTSFPALYTSLEADGAIAEVYDLLSKAPVFSSSDKLIYKLRVRTKRTLLLDRDSALQRLGLKLYRNQRTNKSTCQEVGEAAHRLDYDSLLVPSVRWDCLNLVLFPDLMAIEDIQLCDEGTEINWPAWSKKYAEASREYQRRMRQGIPLN